MRIQSSSLASKRLQLRLVGDETEEALGGAGRVGCFRGAKESASLRCTLTRDQST